jgi:hypothetical protein
LTRADAILNLPGIRTRAEQQNDTAGFHGTSLYGLVNALNTGYFSPSRLNVQDQFRSFYFAPSLHAQEIVFQKYENSKKVTSVPDTDYAGSNSAFKMAKQYSNECSMDDYLLRMLDLDNSKPELFSLVANIRRENFDNNVQKLIERFPEKGFNERTLRRLVDFLLPASLSKSSPVGEVIVELSPLVLEELDVQPAIGKDEGFRVIGEKGLPISYIIGLSVKGSLVEDSFMEELLELVDSNKNIKAK